MAETAPNTAPKAAPQQSPAQVSLPSQASMPSVTGGRSGFLEESKAQLNKLNPAATELVELLGKVGNHVQGWANTNEINLRLAATNSIPPQSIANNLIRELSDIYGSKAEAEINKLLSAVREIEGSMRGKGRAELERSLQGHPELLLALKLYKNFEGFQNILNVMKNPMGTLLNHLNPKLGQMLGPLGEMLPLNSWGMGNDGSFRLNISSPNTTDFAINLLGRNNPISAMLLNGRMSHDGLIPTNGPFHFNVGGGTLTVSPGINTDDRHRPQLTLGAHFKIKF